jgi:hypothetical protein
VNCGDSRSSEGIGSTGCFALKAILTVGNHFAKAVMNAKRGGGPQQSALSLAGEDFCRQLREPPQAALWLGGAGDMESVEKLQSYRPKAHFGYSFR